MSAPHDAMGLLGRSACVTGATSGIGRAIAQEFVAHGANVLIVGRNHESGVRATAELGCGERVAFFQGDMSIQQDAERAIEETVGRFGTVDILVNNVGGEALFTPVHEISDELWRQVFDLNLNSVLWTCRKALVHMLDAGNGRIINISSAFGKMGAPGQAPYVAAKHAVNGFTKSLAQEVGQLGITVNAVCPGFVETDLSTRMSQAWAAANDMASEEVVQWITSQSALKRTLQPAEVSALVLLLASGAGSGITGTQLSVDGGWVAY